MTGDPYLASKALYHVDRLSKLQKGEIFAPTLLQIDPEAYCNDNCSFCSYRGETMYNTQMLTLIDAKLGDAKQMGPVGQPTIRSGWPIEMATKLPKMMHEAGIPALEITGGGEPTLWRGFDTLVETCLDYGIELGIVTNASNITDVRAEFFANCMWIRFSMDAATPETHQKIHRTLHSDFDRRIKAIQKVIERKRALHTDVTLGVSYIVNPGNLDEIEEACEFYSKLGVDNLRFSFMYDKTGKAGLTDEQFQSLIPILETCKSVYSINDFKILYDSTRMWTYSKPNTDFKKCHIQKFVWAIGADCKVYPCCIVKYQPNMAFADIRTQTLKEIIDDVQFKIKQDGLNVRLCPPCWLRPRNQAISQSVEKPLHANFL